jgi:beta-xylosidase
MRSMPGLPVLHSKALVSWTPISTSEFPRKIWEIRREISIDFPPWKSALNAQIKTFLMRFAELRRSLYRSLSRYLPRMDAKFHSR